MCLLRVCVLRVYTSALRELWTQQAGVNRNACVPFARVRFACVYLCAANVVDSAGGSKPERLCAFCACAFCVCIPLRRESCGNQLAGVNRNACVHFACVRFACVYLCAAKVVEISRRE